MLSRIRIILSVIIVALLLSSGLPFGEQPAAAADGEELDLPPIELPEKGNPKLDSQLNQLVSAETPKRAASFAQESNIEMVDGNVRVIIECLPDQVDAAVKAAGALGVVETSYRNLLQVVVPIPQLTALADIPGIRLVRLPWYPLPDIVSEGVGLINANEWQTAGFTGAGVKVAILDGGFSGYTTRQSEGELPTTVTTWWAPSIGGPGTSVHGTACAEIVYDIAPDADFYLVNFGTEVELGNAVDWLIAQGVDVISYSVGWPIGGPGDGTGLICEMVDAARAAGILWSSAIGNEAQHHWQGDFVDSEPDGFHEFFDGDETNEISVNSGEPIIVGLKWDDTWGASGNDYDLYLFDSSSPDPVYWSNQTQNGDDYPVEAFSYTATYTGVYHIVIDGLWATETVNFHLYSYYHDLQYQVASSSFAIPADSPNAMTVGAVPWHNPTTLESFSSQGPTKDNRVKPDLVAPDGVTTATYGASAFYGTSASAPHAAGAAALVKQRYPSYTPAEMQAFLENRAIDLGDAGKDNLYGSGRLDLGSPGIVVTTVSLSDRDISAPANYTITFTITEELTQVTDDSITVKFPADTLVDNVNVNAGDITIAATSGIGTVAFSALNPAAINVNTTELTVEMDVPADIGAMASVQIKIGDVINPSEPGDYVLCVKTSGETTYVESESYTLKTPIVGGPVYVYNAVDILIDFYAGLGALDNVRDAGYFTMDDFTIEVGPGTYLLTGAIVITGAGLTFRSSDGAEVTIIDANEFYSIIINNEDVTIDDLTINDADVGITVNGAGTVITNCKIIDADSPGPGIAITAAGTYATMSYNEFDRCPIAIELQDGASGATISGNTILNSGYGITMYPSSSNNTIYHNNIINCTDEYAWDDAEGGNNKWDNGSEGNYWSNYDGVDANSDGIGDTPYSILGLAGSLDNYPLMEPYSVLVSLRIVVALQGRPTPPDNSWIIPVDVWLHAPGATWTETEGHGCLYHFETQTSNEGIIELLVEPGTYDIRVKGLTTLKNLASGVEVSPPAPVEVNLGTLIEGDVNGDNVVTGMDYSGVIMCFGYAVDNTAAPEPTPNCDFNNDGYITGIDYSGLIMNFGLGGADIE